MNFWKPPAAQIALHGLFVGQLVLAGIVCSCFLGCGPAIPAIVPVHGVLTIDGKPLPGAQINFYPLQDSVDGNYVATAVTDKDGAFTLSIMGGQTEGACACESSVTINEGPLPDELRAMGQRGVPLILKHRKSLKNRPIPGTYATIGSTPIRVTVTADQSDYPIELTRTKK